MSFELVKSRIFFLDSKRKLPADQTLPSYPPHLCTAYRHGLQALARGRWITILTLVEIIRRFHRTSIYFPSSSGTKVIGESGKGFSIRSPASSNSEAVRSKQVRARWMSAASDEATRD